MSANLARVPHFIRAKTPEMLVREMAKLQARDKVKYVFDNITRVDGQWHAWYERDFKSNKLKQEVKDGISQE
jgi:hypothetical protein